MGKCKRKMADGGMVAEGQKTWQERLAEMWATKPKPAAYADGGAVETPEQVIARMAKKYGTEVPEQKAETPPQRKPAGQPQQNPQQPTSRPASLVDFFNRRNDELKKAANYAVGGIVGEDPSVQQSQGILGSPDYSTGPKQSGFVWSDGTRRDGLTPDQAQKQDAQAIAAPVVAPQPAPLMTMAEKQVAQGINPNAAYRPGGPGDPHASGGLAATAAQTASLAAAQPILPVPPIAQPIVNPMDTTHRSGQRRTAAYADGGMVRFAGNGGPRDDKIPVKVAGDSIRVSDGESAVILPAKTAANPQAVQAIGQIIQQSNDGRAPKMGINDGGRYSKGTYPYTDDPIPTAQQVYRDVYPTGMVSALTPGAWNSAKITAPPGSVGGGMSSSGTDPKEIPKGGTISSLLPALSQIHEFAKPAYDLSPSARAVASIAGGVGNVFSDSAQAQREGTTYADIKARRESQARRESLQQEPAAYSNEGRPSAIQQVGMAAQASDPRIAAPTGNSDARVMPSGAVEVNMGRGFDPTKLKMAPGSGMITDATGRTMILNDMSPNQYTSADGTKNARWEQTQQYLDAQARQLSDNARLAEMQAVRQGRDPVQAISATQGMVQAAQRAPLDRQVVQQQIETGKMTAQNAQRLQDAADAVTNAKTPEERSAAIRTYHALNGKSDEKPIVVDLGDEFSPDGITKRSRGQVALDPITHQPISLTGTQPVQQSFKTPEEAEAAKKAGKLKTGDVVVINGRQARVN